MSVDARWSQASEPSGSADLGRFPRWAGPVDRRSILRSLAGLAEIAATHGGHGQAATLVGAFEALSADGGVLSDPPATAGYARAVAIVQRALGTAATAALVDVGRALPMVTSLEIALDVTVPDDRSTAAVHSSDSRLTPRELEVLRLVAEGKSNAQIAETLYVGVRTVRSHVASILAKLGVPTRTAATAHAIHCGLIESAHKPTADLPIR
jgi:DNA-binding CsgD family transcriptional regulator